jgi:hypothetical protein
LIPFSFRDKVPELTSVLVQKFPTDTSTYLHTQPLSLNTLESFTGGVLTPSTVLKNINHPENALNMEINAHHSFNNLGWGIEAKEHQSSGGKV